MEGLLLREVLDRVLGAFSVRGTVRVRRPVEKRLDLGIITPGQVSGDRGAIATVRQDEVRLTPGVQAVREGLPSDRYTLGRGSKVTKRVKIPSTR